MEKYLSIFFLYIYFLFSRCGCDECVTSSEQDSLRHSQARINAYRALTSPSLIALSSRDPLLTAFELSWELRRLSRMEQEFRFEYEVWIFTLIFWLINSFNICSMFNFVSHLFGRNYFILIFRAIILRIGNARTDAKFCHILAGSCSHVLGIGDNVKLQSLWRQLGAWRTTNLGSTQACH